MVMLHFVLFVHPTMGGEFAAGPIAKNDIVGRPGASTVLPGNARPANAADTAAF